MSTAEWRKYIFKLSVKLVYLMSGDALHGFSVTVTCHALPLLVVRGGRRDREAGEGEGAGEEDARRPARRVGGREAGGPAEGGRVEGLEGVQPGEAAEEEHRVALKRIKATGIISILTVYQFKC